MKKMLAVACGIFIFASCQKVTQLLDGIPFPHGVDSTKYQISDTSCVVLAQTSPYIDKEPQSQAFGFRKVVNPNTGVIDSLITAIGYTLEIDSGFFAFEYLPDNNVHVTSVIKTYNRFNSEKEWEMDVASMVDYQFQLDENNHVVSVAGSFGDQFIYEGGLLRTIQRPSNPAPYNVIAFSYDSLGNLVSVVQGNEENNYSIKYEYNYSHTARAQIYSPIPLFQLYVYEMMGWIPMPSKNLRTRHTVISKTTDTEVHETVQRDIHYSHHEVNSMGALHSFHAHIDGINLDATIVNTFDCSVKHGWHMPPP